MKFFYKAKFWPILVPILLIGILFFSNLTRAVTTEYESQTITVQMSTPSALCGNSHVEGSEECDDGNFINGDGCDTYCKIEPGVPLPPPPPPPTDSAPTISNVTSNTTINTARIAWQASDDKGISTTTFVYGKTVAYGSSGTVSGSYEANLSGLDSNTTYYYKISVTDTKPQTTDFMGSFQTLASVAKNIFLDQYGTNWVGGGWDTTSVIQNTVVKTGTSALLVTHQAAWSGAVFDHRDAFWNFFWILPNDYDYLSFDINPGATVALGISKLQISLGSGSVDQKISKYTTVALPNTWYHVEVPIADMIGTKTQYGRITFFDNSTETNFSYYLDNVKLVKGAMSPPPDITPPVISNIVSTPGTISASVSWSTNEEADSQVNYGLTTAYGLTVSDINRAMSHAAVLPDLLPNTDYHFKIFSTDAAGNGASTGDNIFKTLKDSVAPPDVSGLSLSTTTNSIALNWTNPSLSAVPDFQGVKVLRKVGSRSASSTDGVLLYNGSGHGLVDNNVLPNTDYFYTVFSYDTSDNHSAGAFVNGQIIPPPAPQEICGNGFDDDNNGQIDCADAVCSGLPACQIPAEICNNGLDDDRDGSVDCLDTNCATDASCRPIPTEICDNGTDDDGDGAADCSDSDCSAALNCITIIRGVEICTNNTDDDADGLVDCADSDCAGFSGCQAAVIPPPRPTGEPTGPGVGPTPVVPTSSVPVFEKINISSLLFLAGNRQIRLSPVNGRVTGLASSNFSVGAPKNILAGVPQNITFVVDNADQHQMSFDSAANTYFSDIIFPRIGEHSAFIKIDYGLGQVDVVEFVLNSLPWGEVRDDSGNFISDAEITLYESNGRKKELGFYGERNPIFSDINGSYGWIVPTDRYYVVVKKDGYYERSVPIFLADNNIVNINFTLIVRPPPLAEVIDPEASLGENTLNVAKNLLSKAKTGVSFSTQEVVDTVAVVQEAAKDPVVQEVAVTVVAPTTVAVATAGTAALVSWGSIWPLLRLLFLQPLMLFGRRKRKQWGEVYHTLTKLPVDLAVVRLLDAGTGKIVQSKVTDGLGRYVFLVNPGKYRLSVVKAGLVFPSVLLSAIKDDGRRADIYHGEDIDVSERDTAITANIPLDPIGAVKPPWRIRLEKFGRSVQYAVSWMGLIITGVSLYLSPRWYVWVLLGVHLSVFLLFRRLAMPPKPKGWGIVFDKQDRRPIARVVARLFDSQFNKLVGTEITDAKGRYAFLAGESKYYIAYEHAAYQDSKTDIIDLVGKESSTITMDVALEKKVR